MLSTRDLFERRGIDDEVVCLDYSLGNHEGGRSVSLREAHDRFLQPIDGDGYTRGCHGPPNGTDIRHAVPSWVSADDAETRTVEGVLTKSKITHTDFPLEPWHTYYDWNYYVDPDRQYTYLLSEYNVQHRNGSFECEWDTSNLPKWTWPHEDQRIWMVGRWIYDCGHPKNGIHKTEIHPPKAVASFRREAVRFGGNAGPTRASQAALYVGRDGGYWRQPINDRDYEFDLYLPPKPYPEAEPRWHVEAKTGQLPVQPAFEPYPFGDPRALRVTIPLEGVTPHPEEYGAIISGGWSDPRGTESSEVDRIRVDVEKIHMNADLDPLGDEWYVYVGVNGRWKVWEEIGGWEESLNFDVNLDLHPDDPVLVSVCGFEADAINNYMGDDSGHDWSTISDPDLTNFEAGLLIGDVLTQQAFSFGDENKPIGHAFERHAPTEIRSHMAASNKTVEDSGEPYFELEYRIERR